MITFHFLSDSVIFDTFHAKIEIKWIICDFHFEDFEGEMSLIGFGSIFSVNAVGEGFKDLRYVILEFGSIITLIAVTFVCSLLILSNLLVS